MKSLKSILIEELEQIYLAKLKLAVHNLIFLILLALLGASVWAISLTNQLPNNVLMALIVGSLILICMCISILIVEKLSSTFSKFISTNNYLQNKIQQDFQSQKPNFELTDPIVYINGFYFQQIKQEIFTVIDHHEKLFLLQNKKTLELKEVPLLVLLKDYEKA